MLEEAGQEVASEFFAQDCPFCNEWADKLCLLGTTSTPPVMVAAQNVSVSVARFKRHVAIHQEELAIIALPRVTEEAGTASVLTLAVIIAAIRSTKSLSTTAKRYKDRDKTISRLQHELEDLTTVLNSLKEAADSDKSISTLLESPVNRCSQICREFEDAIKKFRGKTKTGLTDWTRLEFMRGNIYDFMDTLANYKSTIMVGLGIITMSVAYLGLLGTSADHPRGIALNSVTKSLTVTMR